MSEYTSPPPAAPSAPPQAAAYGAQMPQRSPIVVWLLGYITLGIYALVWYYKIHKEMQQFDPRQGIKPGVSLCAILFGWILIVPPFISVWNTAKSVRECQRVAGLQPTCSPGLTLLLCFIFSLYAPYLQSEINKVIGRYQGAQAGQQVPLAA